MSCLYLLLYKYSKFAQTLFIVCCVAGLALPAAAQSFKEYVGAFAGDLRRAGVNEDNVASMLEHVRLRKGLEGNAAQIEESSLTVEQYLKRKVSNRLVNKILSTYSEHRALFASIHREYDVSIAAVLAIWGLGSEAGRYVGFSNAVETLLSWAYINPNRRTYYEQQVAELFKFIQQNHYDWRTVRSSLTGNVSQVQFSPQNINRYSKDGDRDGRVDLWGSQADVFHTIANYLDKSGWQPNLVWGERVVVLEKFSQWHQIGLDITLPVKRWYDMGVRSVRTSDGLKYRSSLLKSSLYRSEEDRLFLLHDNFFILLNWQKSIKKAIAVGLLAHQIEMQIAQRYASISVGASESIRPQTLQRSAIRLLQKRLNALGHDSGVVDGIIGKNTRRAIRGFQQAHGLSITGEVNAQTLRQLEHLMPF